MKNLKMATMGLCVLSVCSCATKQGTGTLIGAGGGSVLGAIVGRIAGNTAVGAAIGGGWRNRRCCPFVSYIGRQAVPELRFRTHHKVGRTYLSAMQGQYGRYGQP